MRIAIAGAAILVLGGCQREPSFDERYGKAANEIQERGRAIDSEIERPANEAEPQPAGTRASGD